MQNDSLPRTVLEHTLTVQHIICARSVRDTDTAL